MSDPRLTPTLADDTTAGAPVPLRGATIGRFLVLGPLGSGGMGAVLAAYDPDLDRKVALKLLRGDAWASLGAAGRRDALVREAQAMARLGHPNVVAVYEIGFVDEIAFLVMEQIEGSTLRDWLAERARGWREILEMLRGAGAGLAAAHRAGVIHRDIKPDNVLVGSDGRPRVSDFGLAAAAQLGAVAGTRAYMAPEQAAGEPLDARADQYAFCVMAWEALEGQRPKRDATPERARKAPAWLARALTRGLAARPDDRWPTMDALLEAMRPRASRLSWLLVLGGAAAAATALAVLREEPPPVCKGGAALVAPLWDAATQARVAAAFRATGSPSAEDAYRRTDGALRDRLAAWGRAHDDACAATRIRHEQSDSLLDLRMACLRRARTEIASLIGELGTVDARVLARAQVAAETSGDLDACADTARLSAVRPPPSDPAETVKVEEVRLELARGEALVALGKWQELEKVSRDTVARARQLGYAPLLAEALLNAGRREISMGDLDAGIEDMYEVARVGAAAHAEDKVVVALGELVFAIGSRKRRFDEAEVLYRMALTASARIGDPAWALRFLYNYRGHVLVRKGDIPTATFMRALVVALAEVSVGPQHHDTGLALGFLASAIGQAGHPRDALPVFERARAILEHALPADHPWLLATLANMAATLTDLGEEEKSAALYETLLASQERVLGPRDRAVGQTLISLGWARLEQRRLSEARQMATRAITIYETVLGADNPAVADALGLLAAALRQDGQPAEALAQIQRALALEEKAYGTKHVKLAASHTQEALVLLELGRVAEAGVAAELAMRIDRETIGEDHVDHSDALAALARVRCAERRCADAVPLYERALALLESERGPESPSLAEPLIGLCEALSATRDARAPAVAARAARLAAGAPADVRARAGACAAR